MKKKLFLVSVILILLISGFVYYKKNLENKTKNQNGAISLQKSPQISEKLDLNKKESKKEKQEENQKTVKSIPQNQENQKEKTLQKQNQSQQENYQAEKQIQVSLIIDFGNKQKNFVTNLKENATVYDLLQKLQQEGRISFRAKNYDFGVFIEEIDGIKNSQKEKKYWMFYVNDKLSEVGASGKKLNEGDGVVWKYEKQ